MSSVISQFRGWKCSKFDLFFLRCFVYLHPGNGSKEDLSSTMNQVNRKWFIPTRILSNRLETYISPSRDSLSSRSGGTRFPEGCVAPLSSIGFSFFHCYERGPGKLDSRLQDDKIPKSSTSPGKTPILAFSIKRHSFDPSPRL